MESKKLQSALNQSLSALQSVFVQKAGNALGVDLEIDVFAEMANDGEERNTLKIGTMGHYDAETTAEENFCYSERVGDTNEPLKLSLRQLDFIEVPAPNV